MYDELVKALRLCVKYGKAQDALENAEQAADAIEELTGFVQEAERDRDEYRERLDKANDAIEDLSAAVEGYEANTNMVFDRSGNNTVIKFEPKWIPVTERLPLLNTPVLATDGIEVDISWMYGVPPRWITSYTAIDEDKLTHWMPLPQTPKEG